MTDDDKKIHPGESSDMTLEASTSQTQETPADPSDSADNEPLEETSAPDEALQEDVDRSAEDKKTAQENDATAPETEINDASTTDDIEAINTSSSDSIDDEKPVSPDTNNSDTDSSDTDSSETTDTDTGLDDDNEVNDTLTGEAAPEIPREVLISRLESVLFASPEPMSVRKLANILGVDGRGVRSLTAELVTFYQERGIILEEISKGFQFRTHPKNAAVIRDVFKLKPLKISKAALETLAIVAYRQPLTRAEAEQIRGVDCGGVLKYLFEKDLVRVIGRKEEPGRPIIYGTTNAFLELFGLKGLSDLPALHEFSELWEENQRIVEEEIPNMEPSRTPTKAVPPANAPQNTKGSKTNNEAKKPQKLDETDSNVENQPKIGEDTDASTETKEEEFMGDNPDTNRPKSSPSDPTQIPTEVINESEMADILASIDAPNPAPSVDDDDEENDPDKKENDPDKKENAPKNDD